MQQKSQFQPAVRTDFFVIRNTCTIQFLRPTIPYQWERAPFHTNSTRKKGAEPHRRQSTIQPSHSQPPFPFLPDSGERKVLLFLVELHRLVLLHPVRRFHPAHVQWLPVIEVRHLLVCELFVSIR